MINCGHCGRPLTSILHRCQCWDVRPWELQAEAAVKGACIAMSRFLCFVWMEAWANWHMKTLGYSLAGARVMARNSALDGKGLFRVDWS